MTRQGRPRWGALRTLVLYGVLACPSVGWSQACPEVEALPHDRLSVVWVSPVKRRAFGHTWLEVVATSDLRKWIDDEGADLARLLQGLGMRRRSSPPKKRYKVTVFEVGVDALCRPLADTEEGQVIAGQPACPQRFGGPTGRYEGCGYSTDLLTGHRALDLFRARWRDLAPSGFCVLPADRFLREE